jgi:hypothetical protein
MRGSGNLSLVESSEADRLEMQSERLQREARTGSVRRPWAWALGLVALGIVTHLGWFGGGVLTAGDWGYSSPDSLRDLLRAPSAWDAAAAFGKPNETLTGVPYQLAMGGLAALGAPYALVERLVFFLPFTVLPLLGMFWLAGHFTRSNVGRATAAAVYGLNTYILVVGTNQLTVAMAYAIAPLAVGAFLDALDQNRPSAVGKAILAGVALAGATAYEPRIGYLIAVALVVLTVAFLVASRAPRRALASLGVAFGTTVALQLYWVLPVATGLLDPAVNELLPSDPFISFANGVHALALNHPFWTGDLPAVFVVQDPALPLLGLPILAAAAFLLADVRRDWRLVALGGLAIVGVFLVKGENAPFGGVYGWGFDNLPGFRLFRDMSKFNLYVALGYAVLIGIVVAEAAAKATAERPGRSRVLSVATLFGVQVLVLAALGFSAWPALAQRLGGTLESRSVPYGHLEFERMLSDDDRFGRVLWLPAPTRFATSTERHPVVPAAELVERLEASQAGVGESELAEIVGRSDFATMARGLGIRYVVFDPLSDPAAWQALDAAGAGDGREAIRDWLTGDRALVRVVSTRDLDVYRLRGRVKYAELTSPLAGARASPAPPGNTISLPVRSARVRDDRLVSVPFTVDRTATFRIGWSDGRPAARDRVTVFAEEGSVVWRAPIAMTERLTLAGPRTYRLVVRSPAIDANVLANGSFEHGMWGPVGDALNYDNSSLADTGIAATPSSKARRGLRALKLEARQHIAGVSSPVLDVPAGRIAVVRFAWRSLAGRPPFYAPYLGRTVPTRRVDLTGGAGWNRQVDVFHVDHRAEEVAISFYAGPGGGKTYTAALFDDVAVAVVPRWLAELRLDPVTSQNRMPLAISDDLRRLTGSIDEPGTYSLRITSSYDTGWHGRFRVRFPDGRTTAPQAQHVRTAEGMNAWMLKIPEAPARVEASLTYQPQRWVTVGTVTAGAVASALAVLGLVLGFAYVRRVLTKR